MWYCISWRVNFIVREVKFTYMRIDWTHNHPVTIVAHHHRSDIIWGKALKKSFVGLLQILVIRWLPACFVEVGAGITGELIQNINIIIKGRGHTITGWEGYQKASLDTPERLECSWHVFCTVVGGDRGKQVWKACHFSLFLDGHRPPRRIEVCNATNNH